MIAALALAAWSPATADTKLLWGDTHLHTSYSFDAFFNNNHSVDPDYAYRFAKGMPVMHPYHRAWMRLDEPLDFLVVSDHAEFIGAVRRIYLDGLPREGVGFFDSIRNWFATRQIRSVIDAGEGPAFFRGVLPPGADPREVAAASGQGGGGLFPAPPAGMFREAWGEIVDAAEAHYQPGAFTSLIGWEWTSNPGGANLHRVVLTDAGGEQARTFQPVSSGTSPYPDDLWAWLEETSAATGARFLSIPHNSNVSKGFMFPDITLRGAPVDADHARMRMRWERIVEVTQIKGDSETHPWLSPDDEFADFETFPFHLQGGEAQEYLPEAGDYARSALRRGLATEAAIGINPFQFGMIGSTDSHSGLSTAAEDDFGGKMATDSIPETKAAVVITGDATGWTMSASGLAAVWAEENTREAIVDAMHRRETYGTSGPRIRVRFFGGWEFSTEDLDGEVAEAGYGKGVPMGGELFGAPEDAAPRFLVVAHKDPAGANLDRLQVVKGWLGADGATAERVFDVAWAGERQPGGDGRLPAVGNTVNQQTARYANTVGTTTLATVWEDPSFDPARPAFYYARVIEIPTPRHTLYDAVALDLDAPDYGPSVIQERAYTSPIWYRPGDE